MWKFEVYKDQDGGWRWRLVARNTLIVAESPESFERRIDAKQAAERTRSEIGTAALLLV